MAWSRRSPRFEHAIADEPERTFVMVEVARVETLAWGSAAIRARLSAWRRRARRGGRSSRRSSPASGGGRADVHRHGPFRLAAGLFVRPIRARGAGADGRQAPTRPGRPPSSATRSADALPWASPATSVRSFRAR